jgi:hypothetical protein
MLRTWYGRKRSSADKSMRKKGLRDTMLISHAAKLPAALYQVRCQASMEMLDFVSSIFDTFFRPQYPRGTAMLWSNGRSIRKSASAGIHAGDMKRIKYEHATACAVV